MIDVGRPGLIGYECARQLRIERGSDIILVAVAHRGVNEDRRIYYAGFDHQLLRPIELQALDAILSSRLASK